MSELKMTPARLQLLREVEAGQVRRARGISRMRAIEVAPISAGHRRRIVTAAAYLLLEAGLIRIGADGARWSEPIELTEAGAAILEATREKTT